MGEKRTMGFIRGMFDSDLVIRMRDDDSRMVLFINESDGKQTSISLNSRALVDDLIDQLDALRDMMPYDDERDLTPEAVEANAREARTLRQAGQREAASAANQAIGGGR